MIKAKLILIVDALMFLCIATIAGIGLLVKYVLVPGFQSWEIYQRNVDLLLWGTDRHEWGAIHYVTGLLFLALVVLHVGLHWGRLVGLYRKCVPNRQVRWIIAVILMCAMVILMSLAILADPEIRDRGRGGRQRGWNQRETPIRSPQGQ
jgi:hypothetical protein